MNEEQLKQKVQGWIVFISSLILIGKFAAYWLTNSVGILTDAMESIVNVLAGAVSLYSLRQSVQSPLVCTAQGQKSSVRSWKDGADFGFSGRYSDYVCRCSDCL